MRFLQSPVADARLLQSSLFEMVCFIELILIEMILSLYLIDLQYITIIIIIIVTTAGVELQLAVDEVRGLTMMLYIANNCLFHASLLL